MNHVRLTAASEDALRRRWAEKVACPTGFHRHQPALRECEGCRRRNCGPDDGWKTSTGRVYVCADCYARTRRGWVGSAAKA